MLMLKITESNDTEIIGLKTLYKNQIFIGNNSNDIHITEDVSANFLSLEVTAVATSVSIMGKGKFLLNNKRCESTRKINFNDVITIGSTKLKLVDAKYQVYITKNAVIDKNFEIIEKNNKSLMEIFIKLQEQLELIDDN
jgi:hypothetical protein